MAPRARALPKMMLGFVVRRCAVAVGHDPSAEEFAAWANAQPDGGGSICLFGRPISVHEARMILRHRGRAVSARSAAPHEQLHEDELPAVPPALSAKVTSFAAAVARLKARRK
jgi:hypothetical protein